MSHQFRDFRDLVGYVSQHISKDETREPAFRKGLPNSLHEEKPLIVLRYMMNQGILAENKLKEFETALKEIGRKDLAECVRKFSKRKKQGPTMDPNPISESEKLNLAMSGTKIQVHLSHVHVQQLLQSVMDQQGGVPHQVITDLHEAEEMCAEVCKLFKRVAKACEVSHPEECVCSDDDCSSLSSTPSSKGEYRLNAIAYVRYIVHIIDGFYLYGCLSNTADETLVPQELTRATETIKRPIPETCVFTNKVQPCAAAASSLPPSPSPTKAGKGPATLPKPPKPNRKPTLSKNDVHQRTVGFAVHHA